METYKLTVVEPKAMKLINDLAKKGSVRLQKIADGKKKTRAERREFYLSAPVMSEEAYGSYLETKEWMNRWRTK